MRKSRLLACSLLIVALAGCSGTPDSTPDGPASSSPSGTPVDGRPANEGGPLESLEPCSDPPDAVAETVKGLTAPPGTVLTSVKVKGPTTEALGYTPLTPVDIRHFYQQQPSVTVLQIEDEIVEAEGLVANSSSSYRTLFKANAICSAGSKMLFVVAAEAR